MEKSVRIAFCGMIAALGVVLMFLTGLIPVATYSLPALAGLLNIAVVIELGVRWAWPVYGVVGLLSLLLAADKEAALLFCLFFGYYPILKALIERIQKRILVWILKYLVFNAAVILAFVLATQVLRIPQDSLSVGGVYLPWLFLVAGNIIFFLYDVVLSGLVLTYYNRFHRLIAKWFRMP